MSLPELPYTQKRKEPQIVEFKGVNYREGIRDGELQACENMSSRRYPFLSPRKDRVTAMECGAGDAAYGGDGLLLIDGGAVSYDGIVLGYVATGPKQFATVNNKIVIWPDKVYVDLNTRQLRSLEAEAASSEGATTRFEDNTVQLTGTVVETNRTRRLSDRYFPSANNTTTETRYVRIYNSTAFSNGAWDLTDLLREYSVTQLYNLTDAQRTELVGKIIMISDGTTDLNYRETIVNSNPDIDDSSKAYTANSSEGMFARIKSISVSQYNNVNEQAGIYYGTYTNADIKYDVIKADGLSDLSVLFAVGEAVTVTADAGETTAAERVIITGVSGNTLTFAAGTFAEYLNGAASKDVTTVCAVTRKVPDMDYICASENRLWGVSNADEGRVWDREAQEWVTVHNRVIYASALGDPTSFYAYAGLSTDSYAVAVAGPGDFTACAGFSGDALFFKEDRIFRIYGDYPASYTLYTYNVPGVAAGSNLSVGIINDVLYYLARDGVRAWSGAETVLVSYKLGPGPFSAGVAGVNGSNYYLSCHNGDTSAWDLYCYDALHSVWYREDGTRALGFAEMAGGGFYMLTETSLDRINAVSMTWRRTTSTYELDNVWKQKCHKYVISGEPLAAGTYYFTVGSTTRHFTTTISLPAGQEVVWCPSLFGNTKVRVYIYNKDGTAAYRSYSTTSGADGTELTMTEQDVVYRVQHSDGSYLGYVTLPEDVSNSATLTVDSKHPMRVAVSEENQDIAYAEVGLNKRHQWTLNMTGAWTEYEDNVRYEPETVTYHRYVVNRYSGQTLGETWKSTIYYGISGVDGIRFQIPESIYTKARQNSGTLTVEYDTRRPARVVLTVEQTVMLVIPITAASAAIVPIAGTPDVVLPATDTPYTVTEEREVVSEVGTWVNWRAALASTDETIHQRKNYRWLRLRLAVPAYSSVRVYTAFDDDQDVLRWDFTPTADFDNTVNIPLPPNRTDKIRVTLEGAGDMTLKSVIRAYNVGSENTL